MSIDGKKTFIRRDTPFDYKNGWLTSFKHIFLSQSETKFVMLITMVLNTLMADLRNFLCNLKI